MRRVYAYGYQATTMTVLLHIATAIGGSSALYLTAMHKDTSRWGSVAAVLVKRRPLICLQPVYQPNSAAISWRYITL